MILRNGNIEDACTWEDVRLFEKKVVADKVKTSFGTMLRTHYGDAITTRILQPQYIEETMYMMLLNLHKQENIHKNMSSSLHHIKDILSNMACTHTLDK